MSALDVPGADYWQLNDIGAVPGLMAMASAEDLLRSKAEMRQTPRLPPRSHAPSRAAFSRNPHAHHRPVVRVATAVTSVLLTCWLLTRQAGPSSATGRFVRLASVFLPAPVLGLGRTESSDAAA